MSQQDSFLIENLEITDEEFLNSRRNSNENNSIYNDIDMENPVYYSYPYYVLNNFDYQFKISFENSYLKIEEVKSSDTDIGHFEAENPENETVINIIQEHELNRVLK